MMDFVTPEFIATVGFPIVAFLLLYWDLRKIVSKNTEAIEKLSYLILERMGTK